MLYLVPIYIVYIVTIACVYKDKNYEQLRISEQYLLLFFYDKLRSRLNYRKHAYSYIIFVWKIDHQPRRNTEQRSREIKNHRKNKRSYKNKTILGNTIFTLLSIWCSSSAIRFHVTGEAADRLFIAFERHKENKPVNRHLSL